MERTSKNMKTKGKNRTNTLINANIDCNFSELHKIRSKNYRKTNENKLMVQLHHFSNLTKSATTTKAATLHLTGETKAILENDYYKLINLKQQKNNTKAEFVANPFVINKTTDIEADFSDKIRRSASLNRNKTVKCNHNKKEFIDLVSTKFKAKNNTKCSFATACRDINSMISIKDYHRVFCKKIFETRLFINGILVYDSLKSHYSGVSVARNCFRKKFNNKLDKATNEIFPDEMDSLKTAANTKDNRLLQNVIDYYENQENDINLFNEQMVQNEDKGDELILECADVLEERSITPVNEYFSPESFETPPSQRLIPEDVSGRTGSKYQTVFYEKDAKSGKASLFEIPPSYEVINANDTINRNVLKRIENDVFPSCSKDQAPGRVETARFVATGKLQLNELELVCEPSSEKPKKCPKKRLFHGSGQEGFEFRPLEYHNGEDVFVRPTYSPKEFTELKKKYNAVFSPRDLGAKPKFLQTLKVDELDFYGSAEMNIMKIRTPEHCYYPFFQFRRK